MKGVVLLEQLFELIFSNTLYTAITVVIIAVLMFSVLKKVVKLIVTVVLVLIAFIAYVIYSGGDVQTTIDKTVEIGTEAAKDVQHTAAELQKKAEQNKQLQDAKKKIEKELKQ